MYIYVCVLTCVCACMCVRVSKHQLNEINEKVSFKMSVASLYMGANFLGIFHRIMS